MTSVRRIRMGEGQLFRQMRLASLQQAPYAFSSTYEAALQRSPASWREQADSTARGGERSTFIAFSQDTPIGIAALYRLSEMNQAGEVLQVWVDPAYRNRGVATRLMQAIFEWAAANGFQTIQATVTQGNTAAVRFYEKIGFSLVPGAVLEGPGDALLVKEVVVAR
jgi:ribosomal protein S18 acetylase RimI-like enzyme